MGLKTRVMHALMQLGLEPAVRYYWSLKGAPTAHLKGSRRERFQKIYELGHWAASQSDVESLSGDGSTLAATAQLRTNLPALLAKLGATDLLDVGCGDFNWMREVDLPCPYIGVDIVPEVVTANVEKYGSSRRRFLNLDAVTEPLPPAQVVICREVLFHLSLKDAASLLRNVRASGARYLLATTDPNVMLNTDIPSGAWRDINLERAPYGLGQAIDAVPDGGGYNPNRVLAVWDLGAV